jgi:hypothetical protein
MLASAFLSVLAATEPTRQPPPGGMISLTSSEIHHLLNVLPGPASPQHPTPAALVRRAASPPAPRRNQALPKARTNLKITKSGCRPRARHLMRAD